MSSSALYFLTELTPTPSMPEDCQTQPPHDLRNVISKPWFFHSLELFQFSSSSALHLSLLKMYIWHPRLLGQNCWHEAEQEDCLLGLLLEGGGYLGHTALPQKALAEGGACGRTWYEIPWVGVPGVEEMPEAQGIHQNLVFSDQVLSYSNSDSKTVFLKLTSWSQVPSP